MRLDAKAKKITVTALAAVALVGGISVVRVTASDNDSEKQRAIDNAKKIVNPPKDPPRLPVLAEFGDSGDPAQVAAIKGAVPDLIHRYKLTMALPETAARPEEIANPAKKANRAATLRQVFAVSSADAKVADVEKSLRLVQDDTTYRNFTDHRIVIEKWYGVTIDGRKAFAAFHGLESFFTPKISGWHDAQEGQWHVWLERDGDSWRLTDIKTKLDESP
jgi:hypothetical protein